MADGSDGGGGGGGASPEEALHKYRELLGSAERKFARVRDLPPYSRGPHLVHYHRKVFRAYTMLWRFQQERRRELVEAGFRRPEIGEIASRIGQLYYSQYLRTSEARFLLESYVFYEAILSRGYFQSGGGRKGFASDVGLRFKELRFHARFLIVAMLLNRGEVVRNLVERFKSLVVDSRVSFPVSLWRSSVFIALKLLPFIQKFCIIVFKIYDFMLHILSLEQLIISCFTC